MRTFALSLLITGAPLVGWAQTPEEFHGSAAGGDSSAAPSHAETCRCRIAPEQTYLGIKNGRTTTVPFNAKGKFMPALAPDVLYSWMSPAKLKLFEAHALDSISQVKRYSYRTPLGSFGYGDIAVRVKLKPGVKFVYANPSEPRCADKKWRRAVIVSERPEMGNYSEYVLCSGDLVESWSYGTPEQLHEMEAELDWITHHSVDEFDFIEKGKDLGLKDPNGKTAVCVDPFYCDWTPAKLRKNIDIMKEYVASGRGKIGYNVGVPEDRKRHFTSSVPNYWNCDCKK